MNIRENVKEFEIVEVLFPKTPVRQYEHFTRYNNWLKLHRRPMRRRCDR